MLEKSGKLLFTTEESPPVAPRDFGNGVVYFQVENFGKQLSEFKQQHPDHVVSAIAPKFGGHQGVDMYGYYVNFEKRS